MLLGKRIVVVMPAHHAGLTLRATWRDLPHDIVDEVILVDDSSNDDTVAVAESLGITMLALLARTRIYRHPMFNARAPADRPLRFDL